jgi:uncharacterized protein YbjT (DUF2867 family)
VAKYVVAGATGRVGSVVAAQFLSRGADVTVIVRSEQTAAGWTKPRRTILRSAYFQATSPVW